ncbi:MAG: transposase, partial [Armatimonadia bacterium]
GMGTPASLPRRKNIRLNGYDYACEGAYFITIVTKERQVLFGDVVDGEIMLNDYGRIVAEEWERSGVVRAEIELDEYVVMPNHFHAIVNIFQDDRSLCRGDRPIDQINPTVVGAYGHTPLLQNQFKSPSRTLGSLVRGFKSAVTTRINAMRGTPGVPVWQRNYHDHIIRSDREYEDVAGYIASNPANWLTDDENAPAGC